MQPEGGQPEGGQPAGDVAEHADPVGGQVGHPAGDDRADHGDQRARDPAVDPAGGHHHRHHAQREGDSDGLGLRQRLDGLHQLDHRVRAGRADPEHVRQLPDRDLDPDPGQEAEQHGTGQEVGQETEPGQPGQQQQDPGDQGCEPGQADVLRRAGVGQPEQRGGQDGRGRGVRRDDQVARGPEHGEQGHREQQRVQAGDHRHPGDPGVAEHLGDAQRGQRDPGEHVPRHLGPAEREQPLQDRPLPRPHPPGHRLHLAYPLSALLRPRHPPPSPLPEPMITVGSISLAGRECLPDVAVPGPAP